MFAAVRKYLLIGAALAALAIPAVTTAEANKKTDNEFYWPQTSQTESVEVVNVENPTALTGQPYQDCLFLEMNIPDYTCGVTLAEWAAVEDIEIYPAPPAGVDYLFWEMNVWALEGADAEYSWIPTPFEVVEEADDVSFPMEGFAAF